MTDMTMADNYTPGIFINCSSLPFIDWILSGKKPCETRTRDMLRSLIGRRVLLIETGHGRKIVRGSAIVGEPIVVRSREQWEDLRHMHAISSGSAYDWKPDTKVKYCYPMLNVQPCAPFSPKEGIRHGRVWMECPNA